VSAYDYDDEPDEDSEDYEDKLEEEHEDGEHAGRRHEDCPLC
jgi:hypothetical protein